MHKYLFIIWATLLISCTTTGSKTPSAPQQQPQKYEIGYLESFKKVPSFTLQNATKNEFDAIANRQQFVQKSPTQDAQNFYISTKISKHTYDKYADHGPDKGWSGYQYLGYNPNMQLYALLSASSTEGLGFGEMQLLDHETDNLYQIVSISDGAVSRPVFSPNLQYMIYSDHFVYNSKALYVIVMKVNDRKNPATLFTEYRRCISEVGYKVEAIRWQNNNTFILKCYNTRFNEAGYETKEYIYKKANL